MLVSGMTATSCRKPYDPPAIVATNSYLVVEGVINAGPDSTFIKLSRTVQISNKVVANPETGASLTVEGDQNISYPLTEISKGNYASAGLNLDNSHKYRLRIQTANGKQYLSDFEVVLNSPPIDSISYDVKGALAQPGVNIYVSTHDPSNKVVYYRWDYQETWIINSYYPSYFISNGDTVLGRNLITQNITDCWQSDTSSTIVLGSSAKLTQNVIANQPVISIPSYSEKVGDKYSILVRQYALSVDAYNFYVNIKKNTEQLGSIFDALPSDIEGNIHSVSNPNESVIGYISIGSTTSKRTFISISSLPVWKKDTSFYAGCHLAFDLPFFPCCYIANHQVDEYINYNPNKYNINGLTDPLIPIDAVTIHPGTPPIGYTASTKNCVDCTVRGSNKKPTFWQ
ncbi:MAG: DUF4249 domain-containing protein [Bacteroidetes bacterium]|jgi:hypothetical protein|nr:DUF4249 domain-containing protein [Bacteroidota bacterium]